MTISSGRLHGMQQRLTGKLLALGKTVFTPTLELLKILIVGKTEDINQYQFPLDEFIKEISRNRDLTLMPKSYWKLHANFSRSKNRKKVFNTSDHLKNLTILLWCTRKIENMRCTGISGLEKFNRNIFKDLKLKDQQSDLE